jgi:hypothetical protein
MSDDLASQADEKMKEIGEQLKNIAEEFEGEKSADIRREIYATDRENAQKIISGGKPDMVDPFLRYDNEKSWHFTQLARKAENLSSPEEADDLLEKVQSWYNDTKTYIRRNQFEDQVFELMGRIQYRKFLFDPLAAILDEIIESATSVPSMRKFLFFRRPGTPTDISHRQAVKIVHQILNETMTPPSFVIGGSSEYGIQQIQHISLILPRDTEKYTITIKKDAILNNASGDGAQRDQEDTELNTFMKHESQVRKVLDYLGETKKRIAQLILEARVEGELQGDTMQPPNPESWTAEV